MGAVNESGAYDLTRLDDRPNHFEERRKQKWQIPLFGVKRRGRGHLERRVAGKEMGLTILNTERVVLGTFEILTQSSVDGGRGEENLKRRLEEMQKQSMAALKRIGRSKGAE